MKYATCGTGKNFWSVWREEQTEWQDKLIEQHIAGREPTVQDRGIVSLLSPDRLLKLTKYFTLYDGNIKKISKATFLIVPSGVDMMGELMLEDFEEGRMYF